MLNITTSAIRLLGWLLAASLPAVAQPEIFNYKQALAGTVKNSTLNVNITSLNRTTGEVVFGGGDSRGPTTPGLFFTWIWGDGTSTNGFFPQTRRYADVTRNYLVKVIANYSATEKDTAEVLVIFGKGKITPVALDPKLKVYIPAQPVSLVSSNGYGIPPVRPFSDAFFTDVSRADFEYLFHIGATIEYDFVNENVVLHNGRFEQYALRDSTFPGAYALWYTRPVSFGVGNGFLKGAESDFSSMYHEMAHNITLNFPANYQYGGKIDGPANAIFSEAIAQIFQHAAGYELINSYQKYGLDETWLVKLKENFTSNVRFQRSMFNEYMNTGMAFRTYYDASKNDAQRSREVLRTFLTVPYMFFRYVEEQNKGYRQPVKRLMQYLSRFNADWLKRFDPQADTPAANAFRATLWVAAISYTFQRDLRADFRAIGYPVSDSDWAFLNPSFFSVSANTVNLPATAGSVSSLTVNTSSADTWTVTSSQPWLTPNLTRGSGSQAITLTAEANTSVASRTATVTFSAAGFDNQTVTVVQAGTAPSLTTSVNSLTVDAAGGTGTFVVSSNTNWTVASSQPWVTATPAAGSGNATVTLTATGNAQPNIRTATVTVSAGGASPQTVTVTQRGILVLAVPLEPTPTLYPNPVTTDLYLTDLPAGSTLRVYDLQGRLYQSGAATQSLPVRNLPAGTYLLHIDGQGQQAVRRFQKQ
ncbi:hypothetical protein GCM10023187_02620 [Nibrella viscosa]|uniref:Por secretion system C-terminal sorting domain-containing protein n=1 Tax=Nibrella viscosa TaxID=1084524 RepID=A0ABP8JSN3_9BACT